MELESLVVTIRWSGAADFQDHFDEIRKGPLARVLRDLKVTKKFRLKIQVMVNQRLVHAEHSDSEDEGEGEGGETIRHREETEYEKLPRLLLMPTSLQPVTTTEKEKYLAERKEK